MFNLIEKLRDLMGQISKRDFQRFQIGQKVRWFDAKRGVWDEGEIVTTRVADNYVVRDPDYNQHIVNWESIRPK